MTKKKITQSKRGTKDKPVNAEIRRAAERAGVKVPARDRAARSLVSEVADDIVQASELLSEELAMYIELKDFSGMHNVAEAHHRLWGVRWKLGLYGESVRAGAEDVDRITDKLTKKQEQALGGAS